jgi:hypothetical protein
MKIGLPPSLRGAPVRTSVDVPLPVWSVCPTVWPARTPRPARIQLFSWAPGSYSAVELTDRDAMIGGLLYVFTNPVSSGLVKTMKDRPGVHGTPADMDGPPGIIERPIGFFRENGKAPAITSLKFTVPKSLNMETSEMERLVAEREQELRRKAKTEGTWFLGPRKIRKQPRNSRPRSVEPRRGLNPRVAGKDKRQRIEVLKRFRDFVASYRAALARYIAGDKDLCFPYGTYGTRVRFGVMCNGP